MSTARSTSRRGVFAIVALIAFSVIALVVAATFRTAVLEHQQLRDQQRRVQSQWLADAGIARAVSRLSQDAQYTGETWNIPHDQIGSGLDATVTLRVADTVDGPAGAKEISAES